MEMMVEGGPWGHLTPNGEPLLPKTKEGEAMEGMRVFVCLQGGATVSDLRVGNQRKKATKSANKRVQQGACVEASESAAASSGRFVVTFCPRLMFGPQTNCLRL